MIKKIKAILASVNNLASNILDDLTSFHYGKSNEYVLLGITSLENGKKIMDFILKLFLGLNPLCYTTQNCKISLASGLNIKNLC